MNKIIITLISLALVATPALACEGIWCNGQDVELTVNTYFTNDGPISAFDELTVINGGQAMLNEAVYSWLGDLTVKSYEAFNWNGCIDTLNADKVIMWTSDTDESSYLSIGKDVAWYDDSGYDGSGDIFVTMQDPYGESKTIHAGGIGEGVFMNRIETHEPLNVYQSVGLDQFATCGTPTIPRPLPLPTCEWCD